MRQRQGQGDRAPAQLAGMAAVGMRELGDQRAGGGDRGDDQQGRQIGRGEEGA
jgi:hypothetical protein